jgi:hypothetical protein
MFVHYALHTFAVSHASVDISVSPNKLFVDTALPITGNVQKWYCKPRSTSHACRAGMTKMSVYFRAQITHLHTHNNTLVHGTTHYDHYPLLTGTPVVIHFLDLVLPCLNSKFAK